jgi:hypothetical protein
LARINQEREVMNPYLVQFLDLQEQHKSPHWFGECKITGKEFCECAYTTRGELVNKYAFAIPTDEAIEKIASFGKILEIGSGTGYWASLISAAGAEVAAIDLAPVGGPWKNEWAFKEKHYPVTQGDGWEWVDALTPEYTLMMCWPPMDNMAADCLNSTHGDHVIYIGEWDGCTANSTFFDMVDGWWSEDDQTLAQWKVEEQIYLPHWPSVHDAMYILKRK